MSGLAVKRTQIGPLGINGLGAVCKMEPSP